MEMLTLPLRTHSAVAAFLIPRSVAGAKRLDLGFERRKDGFQTFQNTHRR